MNRAADVQYRIPNGVLTVTHQPNVPTGAWVVVAETGPARTLDRFPTVASWIGHVRETYGWPLPLAYRD